MAREKPSYPAEVKIPNFANFTEARYLGPHPGWLASSERLLLRAPEAGKDEIKGPADGGQRGPPCSPTSHGRAFSGLWYERPNPILDSVTSRRPPLLIPSPWGLGFQNTNLGGETQTSNPWYTWA